jgi:hypothetical protein
MNARVYYDHSDLIPLHFAISWSVLAVNRNIQCRFASAEPLATARDMSAEIT